MKTREDRIKDRLDKYNSGIPFHYNNWPDDLAYLLQEVQKLKNTNHEKESLHS